MPLTALRPRVAILNTNVLRPATARRIRGRALQAIREAQLREDCCCARCKEQGIVRIAKHSDHVVALVNGGAESMGNRQLLCEECHAVKTRVDIALMRGMIITPEEGMNRIRARAGLGPIK